ncbi:kinase-like domain-containing protein, partial [Leptodontidium sp. MPI-SDFR-AT-0119]
WQRFTITFESPKTMASIGLPTQSYRDRETMVSTLMNAMWDSIFSNNFVDSTTNLNICRDGQGYFARCSSDLESAIEFPLHAEVAGGLNLQTVRETDLKVVHHWAGWVYVVTQSQSNDGTEYTKKEIPTQQQVESFHYELDSLSRLQYSPFILKLHGVVTDQSGTYVKGMLVEDLCPLGVFISNHKGHLTWQRKLKWARQILSTLAAIHKMGIVMGEVNYAQFGLDNHDNIKAMGIKKRGCPSGWESPEDLETKQPGQSSGIFGPESKRMGQKMDMYQAGLLLWMLATEEFPENYEGHPLPGMGEMPSFYRCIVDTCLEKNPKHRKDATQLLRQF